MISLPVEKITNCKKDPNWDFGNRILYDLCRDNFGHQAGDRILAKVWLIGRSYSVAIERRKNKKRNERTENFYVNTVLPIVKWKQLDDQLTALRKLKCITNGNAFEVLKVQRFLTGQLNKVTNFDNRSFSSKYLHFHLPELFLIYDSRALSALREFVSHVPKDLQHVITDEVDVEYAKFTCKCLELKRQVREKYREDLTNRQLDNLLVMIADAKNKN